MNARPQEAPRNPWGLGRREYEVVLLLSCVGYSKVVAGKLGVSVKTVETYNARIKRKMDARHITLAVVKFVLWRSRMRRGNDEELASHLP